MAGLLAAVAALAAVASPAPRDATTAELYRWVEPDGSITFSPEPPAGGTDYERVNTAVAMSRPSTPAASVAEADAFAAAMSGAGTNDGADGTGIAADPAAVASTVPAAASPAGVTYAPPPLGAAVSVPAAQGIGAAGDGRRGAAGVVSVADGRDAPEDAATAERRARCKELQKRVVSLERSLMAEMPAARMDDTVVTMARYQTSFDDHCRR